MPGATVASAAAREDCRDRDPEQSAEECTRDVREAEWREYFAFKDGKSLRRGMFTISNDIPNRYVLTFRPQQPHPGLHALTVELTDHPELSVHARTEYWVDEASVPAEPSR